MKSQSIIRFHFDNFKKVVRSKESVYNFDTGEIISAPALRKMINSKRGYLGMNHLTGAKMAVPVFGTEIQIKRAIKFYLPLLMKYERELKSGLITPQREKKYNNLIEQERLKALKESENTPKDLKSVFSE